jgi:signal peptidase I
MSLGSAVIGCAAAAAMAALLMLRRCFVVVQVSGTSMCPALMPGDRVLVRRRARDGLRVGLIVVFEDPRVGCLAWDSDPPPAGHRWMIKRVAAMHGDTVPEAVRCVVGGAAVVPPGMLVVLGDNTRSADSRTWGFLPSADVHGVVIRRISPTGGSRADE